MNFAQKTLDEEAIYAEEDLISICAGLVTVDRPGLLRTRTQ